MAVQFTLMLLDQTLEKALSAPEKEQREQNASGEPARCLTCTVTSAINTVETLHKSFLGSTKPQVISTTFTKKDVASGSRMCLCFTMIAACIWCSDSLRRYLLPKMISVQIYIAISFMNLFDQMLIHAMACHYCMC